MQASKPDLREALVVVSDIRDVGETTGSKIPYRLVLTKVYPLRSRVTTSVAGITAKVIKMTRPRAGNG